MRGNGLRIALIAAAHRKQAAANFVYILIDKFYKSVMFGQVTVRNIVKNDFVILAQFIQRRGQDVLLRAEHGHIVSVEHLDKRRRLSRTTLDDQNIFMYRKIDVCVVIIVLTDLIRRAIDLKTQGVQPLRKHRMRNVDRLGAGRQIDLHGFVRFIVVIKRDRCLRCLSKRT